MRLNMFVVANHSTSADNAWSSKWARAMPRISFGAVSKRSFKRNSASENNSDERELRSSRGVTAACAAATFEGFNNSLSHRHRFEAGEKHSINFAARNALTEQIS